MTDTPRTDEIDWLAIDDAYSEALEERCTCGDWRDDISCRHCSLWEKARSLMRQRIAELERGEYVCKKCGLRKDAEFERGEF